MMRIAFVLLLSVVCLAAKASGGSASEGTVEPAEAISATAVSNTSSIPSVSSADDNALSTETPSAEEGNSNNANPESKQNSTVSDQKTEMPLKKVSVSEASNWPFVLLTLLAMIVCILLIAWIVKRFSGLTGLGGRDLKIVSAIAVGTRERVAIVEVRGEQFLIGATPHNISLLHHFSEEKVRASEEKAALEQAKNPSVFAEKLQSILKQSPATDSESK